MNLLKCLFGRKWDGLKKGLFRFSNMGIQEAYIVRETKETFLVGLLDGKYWKEFYLTKDRLIEML